MNQYIAKDILLTLDYDSIISYCQTHKQAMNDICNDRNFWIQKLKRDFNIELKPSKTRQPLPANILYLQVATKKGIYYMGSEKYVSTKKIIKYAIRTNNMRLWRYITNNGAIDWNFSLAEFINQDNIRYILLLLEEHHAESVLAYVQKRAIDTNNPYLYFEIAKLYPGTSENFSYNVLYSWKGLIDIYPYINNDYKLVKRFLTNAIDNDDVELFKNIIKDNKTTPLHFEDWNRLQHYAENKNKKQILKYLYTSKLRTNTR
jgi:hypothetical protein